MVCISGFSGVGKDECAAHLVRGYNAAHTGLADPAKRHMADVYGFTEQQLFGPSQFRNAGDPRYPKNFYSKVRAEPCHPGGTLPDGAPSAGWHFFDMQDGDVPEAVPERGWFDHLPKSRLGLRGHRYFVKETDPKFFLSPREALQLYCELMNNLYLDTWIRKGIEVHRALAETVEADVHGTPRSVRRHAYTRMGGLQDNRSDTSEAAVNGCVVTCFSDFRHRHEVSLARRSEGGGLVPVLVRVKRPGIDKPPFNHRSETEQATIPDSAFDFVVDNSGSIDDLRSKMDAVMGTVSDPAWRREG